jgi:hypothetical protein
MELRRALAGFAPLLLAAASGCASCDEENCGTRLSLPPLGTAEKKLWNDVVGLPATIGDEFDDRGPRVAESFSRLGEGREREWNTTSDRLSRLDDWLGDEFAGTRPEQLGGFFSRQGSRAQNDWCCFPTRLWESIKLAIE